MGASDEFDYDKLRIAILKAATSLNIMLDMKFSWIETPNKRTQDEILEILGLVNVTEQLQNRKIVVNQVACAEQYISAFKPLNQVQDEFP
jgi:hypothetical protein